MDGLKKFLNKYKHLTPPEASKRKILATIFQEECGILIQEKEITLRGSGAYIQCHPTVRGEIRLHTPQILETLHQKHNIHIAFIR